MMMICATISLEERIPFWVPHNFKGGNFEALAASIILSVFSKGRAGTDSALHEDNVPLIHLIPFFDASAGTLFGKTNGPPLLPEGSSAVVRVGSPLRWGTEFDGCVGRRGPTRFHLERVSNLQ